MMQRSILGSGRTRGGNLKGGDGEERWDVKGIMTVRSGSEGRVNITLRGEAKEANHYSADYTADVKLPHGDQK